MVEAWLRLPIDRLMSCQLPPLLCPSANISSPKAAPVSLSLGGEGTGRWRRRRPGAPHLTPSSLPPSYATDDDIVFEDFARLRLKGLKDEDYDDQFC